MLELQVSAAIKVLLICLFLLNALCFQISSDLQQQCRSFLWGLYGEFGILAEDSVRTIV